MPLLYPASPMDASQPDETFAEEYFAAEVAGLDCFLFSFEDFEVGCFRPKPANNFSGNILYRGWMLNARQYLQLEKAIQNQGGKLYTSCKQYLNCHHLPHWYPLCKDCTPATLFYPLETDFTHWTLPADWKACLVKDFVKSLTSSQGSFARNGVEVSQILRQIAQYRGELEGGVCLRQFETLQTEHEERYFVIHGEVFSRLGMAPKLAQAIALRIDSPFFSQDMTTDHTGQYRLIELGDGQVSDRKQWTPEEMIRIFIQAGI